LSIAAALCVLGLALRSPVSASASSGARERGAELFTTRGCAHCHGPDGIGGKKGPSLSDVGKRLKPRDMTTQIFKGGKEMPEFGDLLTKAEISDLVAYLKTKRTAPVTATSPQPPAAVEPQP
jgi:ubiquinol-cytochrome c reductase cytochrome b subunit